MKQSSKIALGVAAGAAALVFLKKKKDGSVSGVGATDIQITGKILDIEYRKTSLYGNNSYWVYMDTDRGFVKAYTAPNAQLGYLIKSLNGKTVTFNATRRKEGGIVLHSYVGKYFDWEH